MEWNDLQLFSTYQLSGELRAIQDRIIVEELKTGETITSTGIVIIDDDAKERGIRPRWGKVYRIGPLQYDVEPGQWVLVEHGRWTRGLKVRTVDGEEKTLRMVDPEEILLISDEQPPEHEQYGIGENTVFDNV
jgi:co-chaperonin GroES (HSP10)